MLEKYASDICKICLRINFAFDIGKPVVTIFYLFYG